METKKRILSPDALMPEYVELLKSGAELPLTVSGSSMIPFLAPGRDSVLLRGIDRELKRGDIVFYRRADGRYILHRLYRIENDSLWFVGDAQDEIEGPLNRDCAFAYVVSAQRKNKTQKRGCFWWDFFEKIWLVTVGNRRKILAAYSHIGSKND